MATSRRRPSGFSETSTEEKEIETSLETVDEVEEPTTAPFVEEFITPTPDDGPRFVETTPEPPALEVPVAVPVAKPQRRVQRNVPRFSRMK